ncbi:MAG: hypothetical protein ACOVP1_08540 [Bacteroidia bacterium]
MKTSLTCILLLFFCLDIHAKQKQVNKKKDSQTSGEIGFKFTHHYNQSLGSSTFKNNFQGMGIYLGKAIIDSKGFQSYIGINYDNFWLGKERKRVDDYIYKTVSNANAFGPYLKVSVGEKFRLFAVGSIGVINFSGKYIYKLHPSEGHDSYFWDDRHVKTLVSNSEFYQSLGFGFRYDWFEFAVTNNQINPSRILDPASIEMDKLGNLNNYSITNGPNQIWTFSITISPIIH